MHSIHYKEGNVVLRYAYDSYMYYSYSELIIIKRNLLMYVSEREASKTSNCISHRKKPVLYTGIVLFSM